jgi:hypothetical protein
MKWGEQNHPSLYWLAILTKEVGELAQTIIDDGWPVQTRKELVQVAAVAVAWLEAMNRNEPT